MKNPFKTLFWVLMMVSLASFAVHITVMAQEANRISVTSVTVVPGTSVDIDVVFASVESLRNIRVDLQYDETVAIPSACGASLDSPLTTAICRTEDADGVIEIRWAAAEGFTGEQVLTVTFEAIGVSGTSSDLVLDVTEFGDEERNFPYSLENGLLQIQSASSNTENAYLPYLRSIGNSDNGSPTWTPTFTPTSTPTPTATPTFTPTPTATPTATPTSTVSPNPQRNMLTVAIAGQGSVTSNPTGIDCGTACNADFTLGATVVLTARPADGWSFSGWTGAASATDPVAAVIMDADKVIGASFSEDQYTLMITPTGMGAVMIEGAKPTYRFGDKVTLTAVPDEGWTFGGWSGDFTGDTNPAEITITGNTVIDVEFLAIEQTRPASDNFNACDINTERWALSDPKGQATFGIDGQRLQISVPQGVDYDLWAGKNFAARATQDINSEDFQAVAKFESSLSDVTINQFRMQGIIVEGSSDSFVAPVVDELLRFEFYSFGTLTGVDVYALGAEIRPDSAYTAVSQKITVPAGADMYMRVTRQTVTLEGLPTQHWTMEYSFTGNGSDWVRVPPIAGDPNAPFELRHTSQRVGVYAGSVSAETSVSPPGHTATIDYFMVSDDPIDVAPDDDNGPGCLSSKN